MSAFEVLDKEAPELMGLGAGWRVKRSIMATRFAKTTASAGST